MPSIAERVADTIKQNIEPPPRWRWYHGVIFYVVVQALTFGLSGLTSAIRGNTGQNWREDIFGNVNYFRHLKQAVVTPPSWAFAPAWTINNMLTIWGNLQVLNKPEGTPGRKTFLALQAASWVDYVLFNAAYFSLRSPINAFVLTITMFLLTIASGAVALFRLKDTKVALSLATLFIWLIIASAAATFQVLWNKDDLYNIGPFAEPLPALEKQAS
ncbi:MAG TPA: TspO/MBR family protein [Ktedonobacteraceae bacterium]|nr:TspO/MBR family protein [Ktedonobacteraceae bacterium]